MRLSIARTSLCASLFIPFSFAHAQASPDTVSSLAPVVVTASRTPQVIADALPATTVITREDIADSGAVDIAGLLRGQAGVDIAQSGGLGSQTSLFLRGSNSNQVLVLVDGMRVNAVGSGAASLAHLVVDQIDHIEIVRGNVSSLYGSEAIGGVVQIFTRGGSSNGDASRIAASVSYGSERTRAASVEGVQAFGPSDARTRIGVAASYRSANGFSAIDADRVAAANPDFDGYRNTSLSANVSQAFGPHEVGVRYVESRGHLQFDETSDYSFLDPSYNGRVQTHEERSRQNDALIYARLAGHVVLDDRSRRGADARPERQHIVESVLVRVRIDNQHRSAISLRQHGSPRHACGHGGLRASRPEGFFDVFRERRRRCHVLATRRQRDGGLRRIVGPARVDERVPVQRAP